MHVKQCDVNLDGGEEGIVESTRARKGDIVVVTDSMHACSQARLEADRLIDRVVRRLQ